MEQNYWDVVIVGGGLAGYVAANYLGKTSLNILLLEKGKKLGGRARTDVLKGQYFNIGPHALYKKGRAKPILDELDIHISGQSPKLNGVLVGEDQEYKAPFTPGGLFSTRFLNWRERMEWIGVLARINKIDINELATITYQLWVQQNVRSSNVQQLLYILARIATYCHAPEKVSAKIILSHIQRVNGGVIYLDGGWQFMIDQLHNQAIMAGVEVQKKSHVKQIVTREEDLTELQLSNGETINAERVIFTGSPQDMKGIITDGEESIQLAERIEPVKAATLDVALSTLPNPKKKFAVGLNDPLYFSVHSGYARLSEDNKGIVLHVLKYLHPDEDLDHRKIKEELEQFLERMQPGWKEYKITSRLLPAMTVNQRLPKVEDKGEFTKSMLFSRPIYVAGDWASPDSMLSEAAITSGKRAAQEILHELR
ncbi:phytoene desaturase family protein [Pontibacillus marinus]|uniref:Amine oxidase domain-containing protein n=1 Tax=Pontibacillus marinus BH030004 = DSM 16465 TaxID=1385511 RepID=A0A0A5FZL9_9BACI|nr:NAD(P)/FAD-dependent oxidoreductase [Pontibacillus marinus]KGX86281.1 hypothetical protein N783_12445 [Pontibacillus marinus BH030004 = DSM 16465]